MSLARHQPHARVLAIAAIAATTVACACCVPPALASPRSLPPAPTGSEATVFYDCNGWHGGQVRPRLLVIDCGFQNVFLNGGHRYPDRMTWTWAASAASSRAVLWVNTCKPDCSAGNYDKYPATVTLWRPEAHSGTRYFSRMTLRYDRGTMQREYQYKWYTPAGAHEPSWQGGP